MWKHRFKRFVALYICMTLLSVLVGSMDVYGSSVYTKAREDAAEKVEDAKIILSKDKKEKKSVKKEIQKIKRKMEKLSEKLDKLDEEWIDMEKEQEKQYKAMKLRIQYMYENGDNGMLTLLISSDSIASALNKAEVATKIAEYDRKKLLEYEGILEKLEEKQEEISTDIKKMEKLQDEQERLEEELTEKVREDKKELSAAEDKLKKAKEKEEEEKRKEREKAAAIFNASSGNSDSTISGLLYSAPYDTGAYRLTRSNGVVYYNGHRETYYSQNVLHGGGLSILGRHVADDGTIRDGNGYICVAAAPSFKARYSTLMTSLGPAKVYDCGCAYGTIDIYVNW